MLTLPQRSMQLGLEMGRSCDAAASARMMTMGRSNETCIVMVRVLFFLASSVEMELNDVTKHIILSGAKSWTADDEDDDMSCMATLSSCGFGHACMATFIFTLFFEIQPISAPKRLARIFSTSFILFTCTKGNFPIDH